MFVTASAQLSVDSSSFPAAGNQAQMEQHRQQQCCCHGPSPIRDITGFSCS